MNLDSVLNRRFVNLCQPSLDQNLNPSPRRIMSRSVKWEQIRTGVELTKELKEPQRENSSRGRPGWKSQRGDGHPCSSIQTYKLLTECRLDRFYPLFAERSTRHAKVVIPPKTSSLRNRCPFSSIQMPWDRAKLHQSHERSQVSRYLDRPESGAVGANLR
jgi:hypothetical protein